MYLIVYNLLKNIFIYILKLKNYKNGNNNNIYILITLFL